MRTLYVDTAISDRWVFQPADTPDEQQPHLTRLAWLLEEADGASINRTACHLVRLPPNALLSPDHAHEVGIFGHHLQQSGRSLSGVLTEFAEALGEADLIVGFNLSLQRKVLERSFRYLGWPARPWPQQVCAMISATPIVQVPRKDRRGGYQWPSFAATCERFGIRLPPPARPEDDGNHRLHAVRLFYSNIRRYQDTSPSAQ